MITHLHASCWNEERMLPFFFRHYDKVVDHYFIHDNGSDDGSLAMLEAHPRVTVLPLVLEGDSLCQAAFEQINELWHSSRGVADWVALCNIDELFWHPDLRAHLEDCRKRGVTFIPTEGYQMVSGTFPATDEDLVRDVRKGVRDPVYDKPSFFNPDAIEDSGFGMARHTAQPKGNVRLPAKQEVKLLHYKYLGIDYLTTRHSELDARMRELDRKKKWGFHYDPDLTRKTFAKLQGEAEEVVPAGEIEPAPRRTSGAN